MSVQIAPQIEARIQERVAAGKYPDSDAVLAEALRLLEERDQVDELRAMLQLGMDQIERGEVKQLTPELMEEIGQRSHERFLRGEKPNLDVVP